MVQIDDSGTTVKLKSQEGTKGPEANGFTFDRAFDIETKQEEVFEYGVRSIVDGQSSQTYYSSGVFKPSS